MPDILEERDWDIVLLRIKDGNCTPFLGSGACSEKIPVRSRIANELAKKYDYPMKDSFYELHIQIYCHECHEFAIDLKIQWEAFNRGS
jgi:hypothetical protein